MPSKKSVGESVTGVVILKRSEVFLEPRNLWIGTNLKLQTRSK